MRSNDDRQAFLELAPFKPDAEPPDMQRWPFMKYDDFSWHAEGEFPSDLPPEAGATHIAMFAAWAALNGLVGDLHRTELADHLHRLEQQTITPAKWFLDSCDGKLTTDDLNDEGNAFAKNYYVDIVDESQIFGPYYSDYESEFSEFQNFYYVDDAWVNYHRIEKLLLHRLSEWKQFQAPSIKPKP